MNPGEDTEAADRCQTCGEQFGADDRFCGACGAVRLASPPTVVERRETGPALPHRPIAVIAAVALAIAGIGAGIFVAVSGGSNSTKHVASMPFATSNSSTGGISSSAQTSPSGEESSSAAQPETNASSGTTQAETSPPGTAAALAAVNGYWADIRAHNFAGAYAYLAHGTVELSESQFVASEREARIKSAQFHGEVTSSSESTATVDIVSLITHDAQFGCRTWTGSYEMTNGGSGWQIARANLSPQPCSG